LVEAEVKSWYRELGYDQIEQTEDHAWGFGVMASRPHAGFGKPMLSRPDQNTDS
jgi:hypothetical protein